LKRRPAATIIFILLAMLIYGRLTDYVVGPLGYDGLQGQAEGYLSDVRSVRWRFSRRSGSKRGDRGHRIDAGRPVVVEGRPGMLLEPVRETVDELAEMMTVSVVTLESLELLREIGIRISFRALIPSAWSSWRQVSGCREPLRHKTRWQRPDRRRTHAVGGLPLTIWRKKPSPTASWAINTARLTKCQPDPERPCGSFVGRGQNRRNPPEQPSSSPGRHWVSGAFSSVRSLNQGGMEEIHAG